jgi:hypothetical protein
VLVKHHSRPGRVLLRGLAAPLALGGVLGGLATGLGPAAVASAAACQVNGSPQPVSPVSDSRLAGVAMITSCDAWGVGTQRVSGAGSMLIEHFDGTAWTVVSPPAQVTSGGALASASAVSTSNVYAAGSTFVNSVPAPVIVHWNGTAWAAETLPSSLDGQEGQLLSINAVSANDVWAVGETNVTTGSPVHVPLILHWNGTAWTRPPVPQIGNPGDDVLLEGVSGSSGRDAWAVGDRIGTPQGTVPFILRWDGVRWTQARFRARGDSELASVSATGPNSAWAVGAIQVSDTSDQALILHWNGVSWRPVRGLGSVGVADSVTSLTGVAASSRSSAFAVGVTGTVISPQTLMLRWNGNRWTPVATGNPGFSNVLGGVATTSPHDAWAVGTAGGEVDGNQAFAERCC